MTQDKINTTQPQSESHENSSKNNWFSSISIGALVGATTYGCFYASEYWNLHSRSQKAKTSIAFLMHDSMEASKLRINADMQTMPTPLPQTHQSFAEEIEDQKHMLDHNKSVTESMGSAPVILSLAMAVAVAAIRGGLNHGARKIRPGL